MNTGFKERSGCKNTIVKDEEAELCIIIYSCLSGILRRSIRLRPPRRCWPNRGGRWPSRGGRWPSRAGSVGATVLGVARLVAHLAGEDALVALLLHEALLSFRAFRAPLRALEAGGQADRRVNEVRVPFDLRIRWQRELRAFVLFFSVHRLQLRAYNAHHHHAHVSRHRNCMRAQRRDRIFSILERKDQN